MPTISRSIIIGHFPLRTCLPQTGCTPVVSLGSLDVIFLTSESVRKSARLSRHSPNIDASIFSWLIARAGCRSVIAPRVRLLKWLMYLDCWIWLARHGVILCYSRNQIQEGILSGIFQRTMRGFSEATISPKSSSHKVLTQNQFLTPHS